MLQYLEKLKQEDMDALIKKRGIQRSIMQDVAKANEVSLRSETIQEITCIGKQYVING